MDEKINLLNQEMKKEVSKEDYENMTIAEVVIVINRKLAEEINKKKNAKEVIEEYFETSYFTISKNITREFIYKRRLRMYQPKNNKIYLKGKEKLLDLNTSKSILEQEKNLELSNNILNFNPLVSPKLLYKTHYKLFEKDDTSNYQSVSIMLDKNLISMLEKYRVDSNILKEYPIYKLYNSILYDFFNIKDNLLNDLD